MSEEVYLSDFQWGLIIEAFDIQRSLLEEIAHKIIPGIHPPKTPMPGGFSLQEFCKSWTPEMAQEFGEFLDGLRSSTDEEHIRYRIAAENAGMRLERDALSARAEKAEAERDKWARNYEIKRLEWGRNLEKWNGIIKSGLTWDQPELPIFIDSALQQGVEDAARLAAIDAAAAKLPEMPILIRHGPASYEKTSVDALGAHATLLRSTAAAAIQERDRYREALERILADDGPIGVPLHVRIIARKALDA